MMKKYVIALPMLLGTLCVASFVTLQSNNSPQVKFLEPGTAAMVVPGKPVSYRIEVRDKEDGFSGYQEIATNEVYLKSKWLANKAKANAYLLAEKKLEPQYRLFSLNGCFNCHSLRGKLAGPAFAQVRSKYIMEHGAVKMLANKIRNGSKGIWGDSQQMPAHPMISEADAQSLVEWIFNRAADDSFDYSPGTEGNFSPNMLPGRAGGVLVVTAFYTDHGLNGKDNRSAEHSLILPAKQ